MRDLDIMSSLTCVASHEPDRLSCEGRRVSRILEPDLQAPRLHSVSRSFPSPVMTCIHDIAEHHRERQTARILTRYESHEPVINIFAHKAFESGLERNVQPLAPASQVDIFVITNGQHEVYIAR
jgi:hypothetical protein